MNMKPDDIERSVQQHSSAKGLPPLHQWHPELSGDMDLVITRDGQWLYQGAPIAREATVKLFSTNLRREDDGHHYLVTPVEKWRIQVEDAPFVAVALQAETDERGDSRLVFTTNTGDQVVAGPDHPLRVSVDPDSAEPSPYLLVRRNLEALLSRPVFYQLAELAVPGPSGTTYGVTSQGVFFPLA